jgi:hypothetical protein
MDEQNKNTGMPFTSMSVLSRDELLELHKRVLERVRKLTPEEGFRSLVASGIYTPDGQLAKEYGG